MAAIRYLVWERAVFVGPWTEEEAEAFEKRVGEIVIEEWERAKAGEDPSDV